MEHSPTQYYAQHGREEATCFVVGYARGVAPSLSLQQSVAHFLHALYSRNALSLSLCRSQAMINSNSVTMKEWRRLIGGETTPLVAARFSSLSIGISP